MNVLIPIIGLVAVCWLLGSAKKAMKGSRKRKPRGKSVRRNGIAMIATLCAACALSQQAATNRVTTATVVTNSDGTITYSSPVRNAKCPEMKAVSFTMTKPVFRHGTNITTSAQLDETLRNLEARLRALEERKKNAGKCAAPTNQPISKIEVETMRNYAISRCVGARWDLQQNYNMREGVAWFGDSSLARQSVKMRACRVLSSAVRTS